MRMSTVTFSGMTPHLNFVSQSCDTLYILVNGDDSSPRSVRREGNVRDMSDKSDEMIIRDKLYIGGKWVPASGSEMADVINSTTEEVMGRVPRGTAEDVDRAVAAARDAFATWSQTPVAERAAYLQKVADLLEARREAIGEVIAREVGMPIRLSQIIQVGQPLATFSALPGILAEFPFEERIGNSLVVREPIGVVGCITPWNYPLHQIAAKVAPAHCRWLHRRPQA